MFLKRNKALAALFFAAVVFLSGCLGLERLSWELAGWYGYAEATTMTAVTQAADEEQTISPTTTCDTQPGITGTGSIPRNAVFLNSDIARLLALGCALVAVLFAALYCWVGRIESALLGPDGGASVLGIVIFLLLMLRSLWFSPGTMMAAGAVLGGAGLLILRSVVQWVKQGSPWKWVGCHRLGMALSKGIAKKYALVELGLLLVCGATAVALARIWWFGCMIPVFAGCFPVWALVRMGAGADELCFAVDQACSGREPQPGTGFFKNREEELTRLHLAHEEAIQKAVTGERFKVELISNVSHDLRTPLTAILGYGELLKKEALSEEGARQLSLLNRKAGYMKDLVDDLFELTKVSSGVSEPNLVKLDLIRLLEQTMGLLDDRFQAAELTVKRHYEADTLELTTDGNRMHQVFVNLMENAIKYALPGSRIHLYVRGGTVRLTNVAGYEMDFSAEEIVERFARGDKARSSQGSGIGLAIAQTYTQSVGGSFRVEIDADQFSAIVELPL